MTVLSEAIKAKLGIAEPLPKPELSSPSPGLSTLAEDLKRSRVSRLLPKVTGPSPFHRRARTVPVAELQDVPVTETEKRGLSALAPLAGVSPSGRTPGGGKTGRPIAQANIQLELPEFDAQNLPEWAEEFAEFLLLTGQSHVDVATKCSLLKRSCKKKFLQKQVKQIEKTCSTWAEVVQRLKKTFPVYETDLSVRTQIEEQPPTALEDMLHDLWHAKQQLATLLHSDTPQTRRQIHHCRTRIAHIRADLQRWHIHRQQRIAQEHERYAQHELPYKAIRHLNDAMTDTGHRTITTVRQEDGSLTNDPATVLQATQDSFLRQHTPTQDTLDADTQAKIDRLPQVFNHAQRRQLEKRPFTIHEVRKAIHSLRQHKTPGYDGLPAEAYYHLPAHLLRILAHRLWDIVTGRTPLPPDWANVVRPLYKKGDWANPDNWRPIVCAVTEVKIVWTISLRRIRPHLDPHIPASLWGAIRGRSPHEAIFLQDTIADMDPVDLIIASLDVKGAFPNTPWLLLEAVWKRLGLPFYNFTSGYIRTRKYTVRTGAGLTPFLEPGSGVPQGGAEGPFLYLLVTLPLALAIEQHYPAYAPYPLLSPLVGFADDTNLTVAHTPHEPHAPDPEPTVTQQANDLRRDRLLPLPQQPHRPPHKVSGHDQGVCHTSHTRAARAPHASRYNHHPPGCYPGRQP